MIKPFPKKAVKTRKGPGGKDLSYITSRALMERLDLEDCVLGFAKKTANRRKWANRQRPKGTNKGQLIGHTT